MSREEEFNKQYPFTNFGQFGQGAFDIRVFDQGEWWITLNGEGRKLNELSSVSLLEILNFLFNKAEWFYDIYITNKMIDFVSSHMEGLSDDEVEMKLLTVDTIGSAKPHEWLASTTLMQKINQLLD